MGNVREDREERDESVRIAFTFAHLKKRQTASTRDTTHTYMHARTHTHRHTHTHRRTAILYNAVF